MADQTLILSVDEEAKLLQPIDEYVGKIQEQIDALRVEGSDRVNSLKNQIAITKEDKNLSKEEQTKIIEECKKELEKAKSVENTNKPQISKLIADAEGYLSQHYKKEYYDVVAQSCKAEKEAEKSKYEKVKAELQAEHQAKLSGLKDAEEIKAEKYTHKNKLFDAQMAYESKIQEIKDRRHDAYMHKYHLIDLLRMSKFTFAQKKAQGLENYKYSFNLAQFLYRNGLQGLGYGLVPMLGGVFELVARSAIVMFVAGKTSFAGVCLADPAAWIAALIPLIPYYIYVMRKWKKNEKQTVKV